MARPSPLGMPAWASRLCVVSPRPPRQVRQRAQVEDLEGLRGPHGKPGSEGQAVCSQGEWLAEQAKGQAGSACVGAEGRVPGCPCRTLRVLGQTPQGFASATSLPRTRRLGCRAGLGWEEVKQNEGRGRAGGCPGASLAGCRRDALALPAAFLPAEGCLPSAEFSSPLLPAFPAPCPGTSPTAAPAPIPAGCWCVWSRGVSEGQTPWLAPPCGGRPSSGTSLAPYTAAAPGTPPPPAFPPYGNRACPCPGAVRRA